MGRIAVRGVVLRIAVAGVRMRLSAVAVARGARGHNAAYDVRCENLVGGRILTTFKRIDRFYTMT
jgi:hypothetical protein